jgi:hypothetical protein
MTPSDTTLKEDEETRDDAIGGVRLGGTSKTVSEKP